MEPSDLITSDGLMQQENIDSVKRNKRFSVKAVKRGAKSVLEEVRNTFSPMKADKKDGTPDSPRKSNDSSKGDGSVSKKGGLRGFADSLKGSLKKRMAGALVRLCSGSGNTNATKIFGVPLDDLLERERANGNRRGVPLLVSRCIDYLIPNQLDEEGIFRLSGAATEIQKLRESFDRGDEIEFVPGENIHNVTGLLKMFVRELPAPLIPMDQQEAYIVACEVDDKELQRAMLYDRVSDLPLSSLRLLRCLFALLGEVSARSEVNKMGPANLATVWAPNIFWNNVNATDPHKVLEFSRQANMVLTVLIQERAHLFKERDFEPIYNIGAISSPGLNTRKRSREDMTVEPANTNAPSGPVSPRDHFIRRDARRAIRSELIPGGYEAILAANQDLLIQAPAPVPAVGAIKEAGPVEESPRKRFKAAAIVTQAMGSMLDRVRDSPRKVAELGKKVRRFSERRRSVHAPAQVSCALFYYNDSKQCQSLKKLLEKCSLVPQELRNEANDGMTLDQAKLLFPEVDQLLVVRRGAEKSFIETHPITENLDDATLTRLIINPETGTVKAPTILAGRSLVVGFEKDTEEYFSCYLFWRVPK